MTPQTQLTMPDSTTTPNTTTTTSTTSTTATTCLLPTETYKALATQLEYYFSDSNLRHDVYLKTLLDLNGGQVPVSIVSQFAKVVTLVGTVEGSMEAVLHAAQHYSTVLTVDTTAQVVCIGTNTKLPIQATTTTNTKTMATASTTTPKVPTTVTPAPIVMTTIILRDVPSDATDEHIRQCFSFPDAPTIQSIHKDVAHCWFVTLDSTCSRDDMVRVMMELRLKLILGETVKARLKTRAVQIPVVVKEESVVSPPLPTTKPTTTSIAPTRVATQPFGYAAALLKPAPPPPPPQVKPVTSRDMNQPVNGDKHGKNNSKLVNGGNGNNKQMNGHKKNHAPKPREENKKVQEEQVHQEVLPKAIAPTWGGGKSFADVLKISVERS